MKYMGLGDEAASTLDGQILATQELGWTLLELRGVEVPGFAKANLHDLPDEAFDLALRKLESAGIGAYCFGSAIMNWARQVADPLVGEIQKESRTATQGPSPAAHR